MIIFFSLLYFLSHSIGQNVSTKEVGKNERKDLTVNYKYKESSPEEREIMLKALLQSNSIFSRYYLNAEFNDVRFEILLTDDVLIGKPFNVSLLTIRLVLR